MMEIGPLAIHPEFQGQGYGSRLMDTVEGRSNAEKCTVGIVSCREDVIPFFEKRGYRVLSSCFDSLSLCFDLLSSTIFIQPMAKKSLQEVNKLYPDDLGEKVITRTDIEFVIYVKERKEEV